MDAQETSIKNTAPAGARADSTRNTLQPRLTVLDGIRGWAALVVVLFHIFWETFGTIYPAFRNPITAFAFNGPLAVYIFFVLSGEALSAGYFGGKGASSVIRLAVTRYTRLTIPILVSCLVVFVLMALQLTPNMAAGNIVHRAEWLGHFVQFQASFLDVVRYSLGGVYTVVPPERAYNPFLWTMRVELFGSALVFFLLFLEPLLRRPQLTFALLALLLWLFGSALACFPVGMLMARARQAGYISLAQNNRALVLLAWLGLLAIAAAYGVITFSPLSRLVLNTRSMILAAIAILTCVFVIGALTRFFASSPISHFLGKISFPLYLMQFPVLISFTSLLIVGAAAETGDLSSGAIWLISLSTLAVCLLTSVLFEPVERLTREVGVRIVRLVLK